MKIFTITVNYNCAHLLERHLSCVLAQKADCALQSIVADNASADGSLTLAAGKFPAAETLALPENRGYGAAANAGLAAARSADADFALVMNPDVFPEQDFLARLVSAMAEHPEAALAGGKLLREDKVTLDSAGLRLRWDFFARDRGAGRKDTGDYDRTEAVFALCGAALFVRMVALDAVAEDGKLFDEDFFMYGEDVDLGMRVRTAGMKNLFVPAARAVHLRGGAAGMHRFRDMDADRRALSIRNRYIYLIKNQPLSLLLIPRLIAAEAEVLTIMCIRPKLFRAAADIWKMRHTLLAKRGRALTA